jgi:hypothetical protein
MLRNVTKVVCAGAMLAATQVSLGNLIWAPPGDQTILHGGGQAKVAVLYPAC